MFAQIYVCPVHGDVWNCQEQEHIDVDRDEIYRVMVHSDCWREVNPKMVVHPDTGKQVPCVHPLTPDEMYWEMMSFDEDEDDNDYGDYDD